MLPGVFNPGDVTAFASRVAVNGVDRPAVSVDLDGGWRSDLPSQISPAGSNMIRGGTVDWATEQDVHERPVTAFQDWGVWRPAKGDHIVIYAGDGTREWPRFTGVVDETTGSVGSGMRSIIVADVDRLSETFQIEALLEQMPPLRGTTTWRWAGLTPIYLADQAMRAGGYYTTPRCPAYEVLDVPLQTSLLPRAGASDQLVSGSSHTGGGNYQSNHGAPWGYAAGNFRASYNPRYDDPATRAIEFGFNFTDNHAGLSDVFVRYGNDYYRLFLTADRRATVQVMRSGSLTEACRIPANELAGASRVEVLIKNRQVTLRGNNGSEATGTTPVMGSTAKSRIEVSAAPAARIAGVLVFHPETWTEWASLNEQPSARIDSRPGGATTWGVINASQRFEPQAALSALEDISDATLSALWIDEEGVMQFAPSGAIRSSPSVQTITTADDVLALSWSDRLLATARRVTIGYRYAAYKRGGGIPQVELARGSRQTLNAGMTLEDVYKPSGDEDWYGVDHAPRKLAAIPWSEYNGDEGSFVGVTYFEGNDVRDGVSSSLVDISMTQTGVAEYTITHQAGSLPAGVVAETITNPDWATLWERNRGEALPLIQGWGKITWVEQETTQQTSTHGPVLHVDLGAMARQGKATDTRNYLVGLIENAIPQITGLEVTPDPRRQIGDTLTIRSENFLGVTIRGKITGISETLSAEGYEQSLNVEPTNVTPGTMTWEQWEQAFPGTLTYTQWEALRDTSDTFDDFNTDPLKGAN